MANNTNWLSISSQSGSSGQTILTLSANKNLSTNYKTAEITAYNPVYNVSAKTYVTIESYAPYIEISPTLIPVADSGGTFELSISANCSWVIAYPDLVSSYSTTAGTGNRTITFSVPSTTADTTLVGNIVVTDESGQMSRTARIEQYGSGAHIGIFPVELYFDSTGGSKTFSVSADCAYNVSMASGTTWASVTPNSGYTGQTTFTVTVDSGYTGDTQRSTAVLIDAPGTGGLVAVYQKKPETRLIVGYYVTSTTEPTAILQSVSGVSMAEYPDGTNIPVATGYTFPSTGMQYVYYTLSGNEVPSAMMAAFSNTSSSALAETVKTVIIPDNITEIGTNSFGNLNSLTSVTWGTGLRTIGSYSFEGAGLTNIAFPEGLISIGEYTFFDCSSLTSVTMPASVTSIGNSAFAGRWSGWDKQSGPVITGNLAGLQTIRFTSTTPPTFGSGVFNYDDYYTGWNLREIIVPCAAYDAYASALSQYQSIITCEDDTILRFITDTSNVKGIGETRTITILNTNINPNRTGLNLPGDFPQQGAYTVDGNVIYLTYPKNPSSSSTRTWTIGVVAQTKDGVSLSGSYRITQNANNTYSIPYTADTSTVDWSGETRTITIDASNLVASSITIGIEGATGVTYTYNNGVITVIFPHNNTASQRNITVTITGETVTGNDASASITYVQEAGSPYEIPYTADTSTVNQTGETRYIYIDCSQLIVSSVTVSSSGIPGTIVSYDSATCIVTVTFPDIASSGYDILADTISIEGETINGNYAYAFVYYEQAGTDISALPMTFVIKTDGYIRWGQMNTFTTSSKEISYSKNGGDWVTIRSNVVPLDCPKIDVVAGDVLRFKANNKTYGSGTYGNAHFQSSTAEYDVYGNIMSMMYGDDFSGQTALTGTFSEFFSGEGIHSAKSLLLPATEAMYWCYSSMFQSCRKMTETPSLPATLININGGHSYAHMFAYCTSLKKVPRLPAIMSIDIDNSAPFAYMFEGCSGLTTIPYDYLPRLAQGVAIGTRLPSRCFEGMFKGCSSLVETPELHYTILGDNCYKAMFQGCTSLTEAPVLTAATALKAGCYNAMFAGCTNLTSAPELPAASLPDSCYQNMFNGCSKLNYIKCLATDILSSTCVYQWVEGVAATGTFVKHTSMTSWTIGKNGIPTNWNIREEGVRTISYTADTSTVDATGGTKTITIDATNLVSSSITIDTGSATGVTNSYSDGVITLVFARNADGDFRFVTVDISGATVLGGTAVASIEYRQSYQRQPAGENDYLTFEILSDGFVRFGLSGKDTDYVMLQYSKNDGEWGDIPISGSGPTSGFSVSTGDIVRFKGNNGALSASGNSHSFDGTTCRFKAEGNIMSLLNSTGFTTATTLTNEYAFTNLFKNCTGLTSAENLVLPATTIMGRCYLGMFYGCTNLTTPPPLLPATTLKNDCYDSMFSGCTSLTSAPYLPATSLAYGCYRDMFHNCTSLREAPELPALTLKSGCYQTMFYGCTNLNYIKCLATNILNGAGTRSWVGGVSSVGTFIKNPNMSSWTTGNSGIPSGWTVQDAT